MIIVIPDIHDKIDQLRRIDNQFGRKLPRIYLGDWTDSFKGTVAEQEATIKYLANELSQPDRTFLWGNHDWHYHEPVHPSGIRAYTSGFSEDRLKLWASILPSDWHTRFKFYHYHGEWLLSHAGFNKPPKDWIESDMPWVVGRARGGSGRCGGPIWLDWNEEFLSFSEDGSNQKQILGHTTVKHPEIEYGSINLDAKLQYVAIISDIGSKVSIVKVKD